MDHPHLSAGFWKHIFDAIRDPILVVNTPGKIVFSNRSANSAFDLRALDNIASLKVLDGRFAFQVEDLLSLLERKCPDASHDSRWDIQEDIYNHPLKDADGNEIPVYVDVVGIKSGGVRPEIGFGRKKADLESRAHEPMEEVQKSDVHTSQSKHNSISGTPGLRFILDESELYPVPEEFDLKLVRFRDLSTFRRSEKWRDELISMISHDIRNPLSAIRNSVSLLLTDVPDPLSPVQERFLKTAARSIDRLTHLLDGVLDLSRIDSGAFKLNPSWIDLDKFVTDALASFETLFNVQRVRLKMKIVGNIDQIYVDADKLEQVLFNLLSNALKFTPDGGEITLFVRSASVEILDEELRLLPWVDLPNPRFVLFTVEDTGLGMNEETLANLFTRYHKKNDGDSAKGSHIGLSISKRLVEAQGGTLEVESRLGIGTEVTVSLTCDERTGYIMGCIRSVKTHLDRFLAEGKRVAFYSIGKESGECWINLAKTWPAPPMINPSIDEGERDDFFMWTLSEYLAVAIKVARRPDDMIRELLEMGEAPDRDTQWVPGYPFGVDGIQDGKAVRFDGYTTGLCLAPEEGESLARLFNISLKRMTKAYRIGRWSGARS